MNVKNTGFGLTSLLAFFCTSYFGLSHAQTTSNWPNGQTVRIIVPFPGGASTFDSVVRAISPDMGKFLGSAVLIDNKPGAGTGIWVVAQAKANDGHTVWWVAQSFTVNPSLGKKLPFKFI